MDKLSLIIFIIFFSEVLLNSGVEGGKNCTVTKDDIVRNGGPNCVFPWRYMGTLYNRCILKDSFFPGIPWCATELNSAGGFMGKRGNCEEGCEKPEGNIEQ